MGVQISMDNGMDSLKTRPRIKLETTPLQVSLSMIAAACVFASWLLVAAYYRALPAVIPTHFGFSGTPDAWGPKSTLLPLPVIGTVMYLLLTITMRFPHTFNYPVMITPENAKRQYANVVTMMSWLRVAVTALTLYTNWLIVRIGLRKSVISGPYTIPAMLLALVFAPIAYHMWRAFREK